MNDRTRAYDAVLTVTFNAANFRQLADMEDRLRAMARDGDLGEEGKGYTIEVKAKRGTGAQGQAQQASATASQPMVAAE